MNQNNAISLIGIFAYPRLPSGCPERLREKGVDIQAVYSPVPLHEVEEVLSAKPSQRPLLYPKRGAFGNVSGFFFLSYTSLQWNFIVSGKPVVSYVPMVIVAFEFSSCWQSFSTCWECW